nr:MAG TPA: hypothetical protein [Caudoviricetes sp.]
MGIPFTSYGYNGGGRISGPGYHFDVDREVDCWIGIESDVFMPVESSSLYHLDNRIACESFTILPGKRAVQVNMREPDSKHSYVVKFYPLDEMYMVGDTFSLTDD